MGSNRMLSRGVLRSLPRVQTRLAHTDKVFPNLDYYRQAPAPAASSDFLDAQVEEAEVRRAHYYTMNVAINAAVTWGVANFVLNAVNILNPTKDVLALATVEIEPQKISPERPPSPCQSFETPRTTPIELSIPTGSCASVSALTWDVSLLTTLVSSTATTVLATALTTTVPAESERVPPH